jgi:hypothetical protein
LRRSILRLPDGHVLIARIRERFALSRLDRHRGAPRERRQDRHRSARAVVVLPYQCGIAAAFDPPFAVGEIDESTRL